MPPRRASATEETEEKPADDDTRSATIGDVKEIARQIVDEVKGLFGGGSSETETTEETADEVVDELPSPRRVEVDTEKAVREALGGLTINVNNHGKEEKTEKPEPEETPGGKSFLSRMIGLS